MRIRMICFGKSTENLQLAIKYEVIGVKRKEHFSKDEPAYFVKKDGADWNVYARAFVDGDTDRYPFKDGNAYYTYSIKNLELCEPYSINEICRNFLGPYWGLKLQQPNPIDAPEFITKIGELFEDNIAK